MGVVKFCCHSRLRREAVPAFVASVWPFTTDRVVGGGVGVLCGQFPCDFGDMPTLEAGSLELVLAGKTFARRSGGFEEGCLQVDRRWVGPRCRIDVADIACSKLDATHEDGLGVGVRREVQPRSVVRGRTSWM